MHKPSSAIVIFNEKFWDLMILVLSRINNNSYHILTVNMSVSLQFWSLSFPSSVIFWYNEIIFKL